MSVEDEDETEPLRDAERALVNTVRNCVSAAFNAATALRAVRTADGNPEVVPQTQVVLSCVVGYLESLSGQIEDEDPAVAERVSKAARELEKLCENWEDRGVDV